MTICQSNAFFYLMTLEISEYLFYMNMNAYWMGLIRPLRACNSACDETFLNNVLIRLVLRLFFVFGQEGGGEGLQ